MDILSVLEKFIAGELEPGDYQADKGWILTVHSQNKITVTAPTGRAQTWERLCPINA